jgi:superoxide dismutase, Cu-Zn family
MRTRILLPLLAFAAACGRSDSARSDTAGTATVDTAAAVSAGAGAGASAATSTSGPSAEVRDSSGRALGVLTLSAASGGIMAMGHVIGLPPGQHGIHLHAVGQCTPPFESAGPHWNPGQKKHGTQNPQGPHQGDMPNLTVGSDSSVHVMVTSSAGALDSLLDADGAAVVIHEKADDYKTDPSGDSGRRIACGVVKR